VSHEEPTTEEVRDQFSHPHDKAWFDRWLRQHDAKVWEEGRTATAYGDKADAEDNPYGDGEKQ